MHVASTSTLEQLYLCTPSSMYICQREEGFQPLDRLGIQGISHRERPRGTLELQLRYVIGELRPSGTDKKTSPQAPNIDSVVMDMPADQAAR